MLIDGGADVNQSTLDNEAPLDIVACKDNVDIVHLLIE